MPIRRYLIITFIVLTSLAFTLWAIYFFQKNPNVPIYFILDNKNAIYTIGKESDHYTVRYFENEEHFKANLPHAEIFIGKSPIDPEPFLGKKVEVIGEYRKKYSDTQCIKENCSLIFENKRKSIVIDVQSIKEVLQEPLQP